MSPFDIIRGFIIFYIYLPAYVTKLTVHVHVCPDLTELTILMHLLNHI